MRELEDQNRGLEQQNEELQTRNRELEKENEEQREGLAKRAQVEEAMEERRAEWARAAAARISDVEALLTEACADIAESDSCLRAAAQEVGSLAYKPE